MVWGLGVAVQADQEGVEVLDHLPPDVVDRSVALVDHDEVERLHRDFRSVLDRDGLAAGRTTGLEERLLLVGGIVLGLALQDRVEALDGRDDDLAGRVDGVAAQVLNRELVGEGVGGRRIPELLELVQRLAPEVVAVHQEEDALGVGVLDEPVAGRHRHEGLAAAGGHLDESARAAVGKRPLEITDGVVLDGPQLALRQFGHLLEQPTQLSRPKLLLPEQLLGPMEGEDLPAARVRVEAVGELSNLASGLVREGEGAIPRGDLLVEPFGVAFRLDDDPSEGVPHGLRLDDPRWPLRRRRAGSRRTRTWSPHPLST